MLANISKFINIKEYQESFELDLNRGIVKKDNCSMDTSYCYYYRYKS